GGRQAGLSLESAAERDVGLVPDLVCNSGDRERAAFQEPASAGDSAPDEVVDRRLPEEDAETDRECGAGHTDRRRQPTDGPRTPHLAVHERDGRADVTVLERREPAARSA